MAKLRFHADGEHLPVEACLELVAEFDGIRYRAKVTEANSRMFRAQLLEPFCRSLTCELPVFVVAMSSFRLVRDAKPTTEMLKLLHSKMEAAHQESLRRCSIEVAVAQDGPRLESLFREAEAHHAALVAEEDDLVRDMPRTASPTARIEARIRREIQRGMKGGRIGREEGLFMLQEHYAIRAAADAQLPDSPEGIRPHETRRDAVRAAKAKIAAEFLARTGFSLEAFRLFLSGRS